MTRLVVALCAAALAAAHPVSSPAQVTTEEGASILIFPKVVASQRWDTIIRIANTSESGADARCAYVNGELTFPGEPPGPLNPPLWQRTAFSIALGLEQPTHWVASRGRPLDLGDPPCSPDNAACEGAGFDPGDVPPLGAVFRGLLVCVEVDVSGAPLVRNHLSGQATLVDVESGDVAAYSALGLRGTGLNDGDGVLCLGGEPSAACPVGAEYDGCPAEWLLSLPAEGASDTFGTSSTDLAVLPCSQDLLNEVPSDADLLFEVVNELGQTFTASSTVTCWEDLSLADLGSAFQRQTLGSDHLRARIRPAAGSGGVALVAHTFQAEPGSPSLTSSAIADAQQQPEAGAAADLIRLDR